MNKTSAAILALIGIAWLDAAIALPLTGCTKAETLRDLTYVKEAGDVACVAAKALDSKDAQAIALACFGVDSAIPLVQEILAGQAAAADQAVSADRAVSLPRRRMQ